MDKDALDKLGIVDETGNFHRALTSWAFVEVIGVSWDVALRPYQFFNGRAPAKVEEVADITNLRRKCGGISGRRTMRLRQVP